MTASDTVCITVYRKPAENTSRKALNNGKRANSTLVNTPAGSPMHSKSCSAMKTC